MADSDIRNLRRDKWLLRGLEARLRPAAAAPLTMVLPLPPSLNNLYANTPTGRRMSKEGREYKQEVHKHLNYQRVRPRCPQPRYEVWLWFLMPDRRRRDLSNLVKAIEDVVSNYLGYDDSLHDAMHLYKALDRDDPRCVMVLAHKEHRVPLPGVTL